MTKALNRRPVETRKYNAWVRYFLGLEGDEETKKKTLGNKTQSALLAYGLDPVKQYTSATVVGMFNYKKLKYLAADLLEREGITFSSLIKMGLEKVKEGSYSDWSMFMERIGYFEPKQSGPVQQTQVNISLDETIRELREERAKKIQIIDGTVEEVEG